MEVHHPKHHEGKRKITEYIAEFLMLFFAVFLGFVAENVRENSVERSHEKEYIEGFIQNIEADTTQLNARIATNTFRIRILDSLLLLSKKDLRSKENVRLFYQYYVQGTFFPKYRPNDATMVQLKNSGGLRLIHERSTTDSIIVYDANNKQLEDQAVFYQTLLNQGWDAVYPIMDVTITRDTSYVMNRMLTEKQPPDLVINPEKLKVFFGLVLRQILIAEVYNQYMQNQLSYAKRLLPYLCSKYNIKGNEK